MTKNDWKNRITESCKSAGTYRELILAGSGNGDSAVTVFGMMAGAAMAHNFGLAGAADSVNEAGEYIVGGIKLGGQVAVFIALAGLLVISLVHLPRKAK